MLVEMKDLGLSPTSSFGKSKSVAGATTTFENVFERAGTPNMSARISNAQSIFSKYGGNPVTKPAPYSKVPGIHAGPPLAPKGVKPKAAPPGKAGKKDGGGIPWGEWGDNLVPDDLGKVPDAITPDKLPNPLSGIEAIGDSANKITTQLFSVSFWIRAAFILVGITLVFIGTKALLSGSAPASTPAPSPTPSGGTPMQTNSAPARPKKPFGAKVKSGVETAAVVMPK
jgi:hypothetical protein